MQARRAAARSPRERWAPDRGDGLPSLEREIQNMVARIARKKGKLKHKLLQVEDWLLTEALRVHGGNRTWTAAALGLERTNFHKKLARLDLKPAPRGNFGRPQIEKPVIRIAPKSTLKDVMYQVERWLVAEALNDQGGNRTHTATALGIRRETLHKKLNTLDLHSSRRKHKIENPAPRGIWKKGTLDDMMLQIERWFVAKALRDNGGHKTNAAAALGITREGFYRKLAKLGMPTTEPRRPRPGSSRR